MNAIRERMRPAAAAAFLLPALLACSDDGLRPPGQSPAPGTTFQPLRVGTAWVYDSHRLVRFIAPGGGDARPPLDLRATTLREIVATEEIAGQTWAVEEERFLAEADTLISWRRYREDPTGLYRADLPATLPPGSDSDSTTAARRLAYPRSLGATWLLHDGIPGETGTLAGIDTLATPAGTWPAFRVAYRLLGDGPSDRRLFWYSERGILASEVYWEIAAVDPGSGEIIVIQSTETLDVREVHLPVDVAPKSPGAAEGGERAPLLSDGDRAGSRVTATP